MASVVTSLGDDMQMVIERLFIGDKKASEDNKRLRLLGVSLVVQAVVGVAFRFPEEFRYHAVEIIDDPGQDLIK